VRGAADIAIRGLMLRSLVRAAAGELLRRQPAGGMQRPDAGGGGAPPPVSCPAGSAAGCREARGRAGERSAEWSAAAAWRRRGGGARTRVQPHCCTLCCVLLVLLCERLLLVHLKASQAWRSRSGTRPANECASRKP
jgi:hypothetical protein